MKKQTNWNKLICFLFPLLRLKFNPPSDDVHYHSDIYATSRAEEKKMVYELSTGRSLITDVINSLGVYLLVLTILVIIL